jgi:ATP-dependent helicase/nuclease subunit A
VILDGCEPLGRNDPPLLPLPAAGSPLPPVWSGARAQDCAVAGLARADLFSRARQEHNRLLYVAMTRAADRLVIAPFRGHEAETEAAWCRMVRAGLEAKLGPGEAIETPHGSATLWRDGSDASRAPASPPPPPALEAPPAWLRAPAPPASGTPERPEVAESPSPRLADAAARRRGALVHALLRHLPRIGPEAREAAGLAHLRARAPGLPGPAARGMVRSALGLIGHPDLAPLFAADARAEVSLSGRVAVDGVVRAVHGRVDRLAVDAASVRIADVRTGRPPGDGEPVPEADTAGIALCARLLARIYPERRIVPMLVWISGPVIRTLSAAEAEADPAPAGPAP